MLAYHYTLTPDDNDTLLIQFPDVPEAAAVAETEALAPEQAAEGLEAALQIYVDARRPIPSVQYTDGPAVTLGALVTAKLLISSEMAFAKPNWRASWGYMPRKSTDCCTWHTPPRSKH